MSQPTATLHPTLTDTNAAEDASREQQLWEKAIERLQDTDDGDTQLAMLRLFAELDDACLPIVEVIAVLLTESSSAGQLYLGDTDELWAEGLEVIERMPEQVPVEQVIAVLCSAYQEGEEDTQSQLLDLVGKLTGSVDEQPFRDLLRDEDPTVRCAGLEACYHLGIKDLVPALLADPDPGVRALAIENTYYQNTFDEVKVQSMADDAGEDEEVRDQARVYLAKVAEQRRLAAEAATARATASQ
jgi:hypothetical protein